MSGFLCPAWSLDWHYRSRDEGLIAFSNRHIYDNRLVTFPGPGIAKAISHVLVPWPGASDSASLSQASVASEDERVVELVLQHAESRPDESLGVITMGIEHARRIDLALMRARESRPELDPFFAQDAAERFFVKNLERVQGE